MRKNIFLILAIAMTTQGYAQKSDFGIWTTIGAEKKINKKVSLYGEAEMRTRNNLKSMDRWSGTAGASYNLYKFLKVGGEYSYLYSHKSASVTAKGNIVSDYWHPRHRFSAYLIGKYKINKFSISLREKWQYTYTPEKYVGKFASDGVTRKSDELVKGNGKNILRSRIKMDYEAFKDLINPYASIEFYHDRKGLDKTRYTAGTSISAGRNNEFDLFYRYQKYSDEDEINGHILGVGYKYKF